MKKMTIVTADAEKSIEILKKEQVPYIAWLPPYGSTGLRSKEEICNRAICLMLVAVRAEGLGLDIVQQIIDKYDLSSKLSPKELQFLQKENFEHQDKVDFLWRYESYWTLLWVLGYVDELKRPENVCDVELAVSIIYHKTKKEFIAAARLKNINEILDVADLTLRYHWAVRNEGLKNNPPPAGLDQSVIYERHYALEWVLNKASDWDDVNTST